MFHRFVSSQNTLWATMAAIVCVACASANADSDDLWTEMSYDDAVAHSAEHESVLLVYATAAWCGPCRQMERTTWVDPSVASWFKEHGTAFKFDVDHNRELSQQLRIRAMPTMIAYRNGKAFDQVVGARSAEQLITWLDDVREGRSAVERMRQDLEQAEAAGEGIDGMERMEFARTLAQAGQLDEATDQYIWLWENILEHEPAMVGVRGSYMLSEIRRLAAEHPPARERFVELRAKYLTAMNEGTATSQQVSDWIDLASVVNDTDSILEWFDTIKHEPRQIAQLSRHADTIANLLVNEDRWADIALLYPNPLAKLEDEVRHIEQMSEVLDEAEVARMRTMMVQRMRQSTAVQYAALLAAGQDELAERLATALFDVDESPLSRTAFVATALRADQPRDIHDQWLTEARGNGVNVTSLRNKLHSMLNDDAS
jgi:thioredoxin 1